QIDQVGSWESPALRVWQFACLAANRKPGQDLIALPAGARRARSLLGDDDLAVMAALCILGTRLSPSCAFPRLWSPCGCQGLGNPAIIFRSAPVPPTIRISHPIMHMPIRAPYSNEHAARVAAGAGCSSPGSV